MIRADWRRIAAGAWLLLGLVAAGILLRAYGQPFPPVLVEVEEPFSEGLVTARASVTAQGFRAVARGYALPPRSRGVLEYRLHTERPFGPWSTLTLQWYGGEPLLESRVEWLGDGASRVLAEGRSLVGERLHLPTELAGRRGALLRFTAENSGTEERLVLDKLTLQSWEAPPPPRPSPWALGLVGLAVVSGCAGLSRSPRRAAALGMILLLAVGLRLANLERVLATPLEPDAQGYRDHARSMTLVGATGFYSAAFGDREPLFPAVVKGALRLFGEGDGGIRLLTVAFSGGTLALAYAVGRGAAGTTAGLVAATVMAVSVPAVIESGRGLRVELEALLFTGCAWLWLGRPGGLTARRALAGALLGGALLLTRFPYAPAIGLLWLAAAWRHRQRSAVRWGALALALIVVTAMAAPHRAALWLRYGDPAFDTHRALRWIANQEFQGQPGFPSPTEVVRDPYAGPRVTAWDYYFRLHTPAEVLWRSGRGLVKAMVNLGPIGYASEVRAVSGFSLRWLDGLAGALGVLGAVALARRRETGWIPLAACLGVAHVVFVYDLDLPDYRFRMILQVLPLYAVAVAAGLQRVVDSAAISISRRRSPTTETPHA